MGNSLRTLGGSKGMGEEDQALEGLACKLISEDVTYNAAKKD